MYHLVLLFAAAALLGSECRSANVNRHMRMLNQIDNTIQANVMPSNKRSAYRKVVNITGRPAERVAHPSGTVVQLTCEAIGAPAPSIRWFKNDAPVYEHDIESNELIDSNPSSLARVSSTLLIRRTEGEDRYTCLAVAGPKTMKAVSTVYRTNGATAVSERTKLFPLEPHIVTSYSMYMDIIGSNIVIPCRAKGHPKPHIAWTDNNGNAVKNNPRMKVLRSGELVISPLRWVDMGEYKCEATNAFGSQIATTFVYPAKAG